MASHVLLAAAVLVSSLLAALSTALVWRERPKPGSTAMAACTAALALWGGGQVVVLLAGSYALMRLGFAVTLVGVVFIAVAWFVFTRQYTGRTREVSLPALALLSVEPVVMLGLFATTGSHELLWVDPGVTAEGGRTTLTYSWGPAIVVHMAYAYGLTVLADWYLYQKFIGSRNVFRKRTFLFIVFSIPIVGGSAASFLHVSPVPHMTLTPLFVLGLSVVFLWLATSNRFIQELPLERLWALFGSKSRSLAPVARDKAVEEMETGFILVDHENRIVDINRAQKRMLNVEGERVVGREVTDVIIPEIFAEEDRSFLDPDADGMYTGVWVETPTGVQECYDFQITPLTDDDGERIGRIGLTNRVTERELRKQTLEQHNMELERQNEQLEDFASIVSHDLRNPLNVAKGRLSMVEVDGDDAEAVETAVDALDRMEEIVEDVLTLARTGQSVSETVSVSLASAAREAWDNVDTQNATLSVDSDVELEADRSRLYQVFENLFRNAVEHGSTSHADADASADAVGHASEDVTVTVGATEAGFFVADDGPGIPADELEQVFEQGYTNSESGTGFGLSIVQTVVEAHGWDIAVTESDEGGARLEVTGVTTRRSESAPSQEPPG